MFRHSTYTTSSVSSADNFMESLMQFGYCSCLADNGTTIKTCRYAIWRLQLLGWCMIRICDIFLNENVTPYCGCNPKMQAANSINALCNSYRPRVWGPHMPSLTICWVQKARW